MSAVGPGQGGLVWRKWLTFYAGRSVSWQATSVKDVQAACRRYLDAQSQRPGSFPRHAQALLAHLE